MALLKSCSATSHEKGLDSQIKWIASSEFGTYSQCEQRRFRRACASAQSRQNLRCSLIQAVNQEEPSDRKPYPWPLWLAGHAQLKFVMTECSKTQIRLTGLKWSLCSCKGSTSMRKGLIMQLTCSQCRALHLMNKRQWNNFKKYQHKINICHRIAMPLFPCYGLRTCHYVSQVT